MLVLSRKPNEKVLFPGIRGFVQVLSIKRGLVRLGIEAPPDVAVVREEVQDRIREWSSNEPDPKDPVIQSKHEEENRLLRARLHVSRLGLGVLRQQLRAGRLADVATTLAKIEEDLELLAQRLDEKSKKASPRPAAKPGKALLVEDNPKERELLATFLRTAGLDVDTAGDGLDALDYLHARGRPDVLLLDMGLPRCDGPTTVREIRRDPACTGLKIFAVTGHSADEFDLDTGPAGIDRWFYKPLDPTMLVRALNQELQMCPSLL